MAIKKRRGSIPLRAAPSHKSLLIKGLREFIKAKTGVISPVSASSYHACERLSQELKLKSLTLPEFSRFIKGMRDRGYKPETVRKVTGVLYAYARREGVDDSEFIPLKGGRPNTVVYLSHEEISLLESSVRCPSVDMWLLMAYTGMRYAEARSLTKDSFIDGKIYFYRSKTDKMEAIPIPPKAEALMDKFGWEPPRVANPVLNRRIKHRCKKIGLTRMVTVLEEKSVKTHPLCDLVTAHTARKSFVSNALLSGVPATVVAKITGHSLQVMEKHYWNLNKSDLEDWVSKL